MLALLGFIILAIILAACIAAGSWTTLTIALVAFVLGAVTEGAQR